MIDQSVEHVYVERVVWMQKIRAKNTGKEYYMTGRVTNRENTLAVTLVKGNGAALFFCETHEFVYGLQDTCDECRNAIQETTSG